MNAPTPILFSIPDFETGSSLLARVPLANPQQALVELHRFLDSLLAAPPDPQTYFQILEHARLPISFTGDELARRYVNKPLPLGEAEDLVFRQVVQLWLKSAASYAQCAERSPPGEDTCPPERFARLLHRCIHFTGLAIIEHHRAHREVPWGLWLDLHGYYGTAEDMQLATQAVPVVLEGLISHTHCTASYASFILCDLAGSYGLTPRDLSLVRRWAEAWAPLVSLHRAVPGEQLPPHVIDLMQDMPLRPVADCLRTEPIRRLDTSRLAAQIAHVRTQLRQRIPPAQLALGDDCTPQQCTRLLNLLAGQWSQARAARKYRRHATTGVARVCTGFEDMHYHIGGKAFQQPENVRIYSRDEYDTLFAFRFQENPDDVLQFQQERLTAAHGAETWEVVNQSADGFRLMRSLCGPKMAHGQLLALCPHDGSHFLLAQVTWLMQEHKGGLVAGIKALPGLPTAICARPANVDGTPEQHYERAFLLPSLAAIGAGPSLVLPSGWFRPGRLIELYTDGAVRVRLKSMLDLGSDFERVAFEAC